MLSQRVQRAGDAVVDHARHAAGAYSDVAGRKVPVHDPCGMSGCDNLGNLRQHPAAVGRAPLRRTAPRREIYARHALHGDPCDRASVGAANATAVHMCDPGMREARELFRLGKEPPNLTIGAMASAAHLEHDLALGAALLREVHVS